MSQAIDSQCSDQGYITGRYHPLHIGSGSERTEERRNHSVALNKFLRGAESQVPIGGEIASADIWKADFVSGRGIGRDLRLGFCGSWVLQVPCAGE